MRLVVVMVLGLACSACGPAVYAGVSFGLTVVDKGLGISTAIIENVKARKDAAADPNMQTQGFAR